MITILDVFKYVFTEVRKCSGSKISVGNDVIMTDISRSALRIDHAMVKRIDILRRNVREWLSIELLDCYGDLDCLTGDAEALLVVCTSGYEPRHFTIRLGDEFNIEKIIPDDMDKIYSQLLVSLVSLYHIPINPQYEKRLWYLHSFGDNYMNQSFLKMHRINQYLRWKTLYLRFMDKDCKTVPIDECTVIRFESYPNHNCILDCPIRKITIQDGICEIIVKGKSTIPDTYVYLYEDEGVKND